MALTDREPDEVLAAGGPDDGSAVDGTAVDGSATISTVERAAAILLLLKDFPSVGITEIARTLSLPKGAVHRTLSTLRLSGLVELDEDTRRYSLGVETLRIGMTYLERLDVRRVAHPFVAELCRRTDETGTLSAPAGPRHRVFVDQVVPERQVIMTIPVGQTTPLHEGPSSRAMLAFLPEQRREAYLEWWRTSDPTWSKAAEELLKDDLETTRAQGWTHVVEHRNDGGASIAAPVFGYDGLPVGAISVCGPAHRFVDAFDSHRTALLETTAQVSERCGARATPDGPVRTFEENRP